MRLPLDIHTLTDIYLRKRFHLPLEPFVSFDPNTFVYINGIKRRSDNLTYLPSDFHLPVPPNEFNQVNLPSIFLYFKTKILSSLHLIDGMKQSNHYVNYSNNLVGNPSLINMVHTMSNNIY